MTDDYDPPASLNPRAAALWRAVVPARAKSAERLALVQTALESLTRADAASEQIAVEGMTTVTKSTGAVHLHPLLRVERENRQMFIKCWRDLGLSFNQRSDPSGSPFA